MNSKEALNNIKKTMIIGRHGNIDVGNKYNKEILTIERDLEVLEILKSNVVSLNMITIFETCEGYNDWAREYHRYSSLLTKEEFNKIKEWLEND